MTHRGRRDAREARRADREYRAIVLLQERGLAGSPYLASIAVEERFRGRGVGTALIRFAERWAASDSPHLFLCVSSFNLRARALYERLGYTEVGEFKDHVIQGASEILMHKSVGSRQSAVVSRGSSIDGAMVDC